MRTALVLVLLAPVLAGCLGQADTVLTAQLDQAAPHCVGGCARIVDDSPARAWEPFLAVNPRNEDHLVIAYSEPWEGWYDTYSGTGRSHIVVSEDGGTTWEAIVVPSGLDLGSEHPLAKYRSVGYDPVVVFLP
ncbi:MAG TPA: hypothetical protein VI997_06590, partial [Candidatus Thermoplasmatota archaeon]|nr:hypothetical protein [Candidatus Thermoplasmatota archaeon]